MCRDVGQSTDECFHGGAHQIIFPCFPGGTGDADFVIKLGKVDCVSHVYYENLNQNVGKLGCWMDRPENVHRKQRFFREASLGSSHK